MSGTSLGAETTQVVCRYIRGRLGRGGGLRALHGSAYLPELIAAAAAAGQSGPSPSSGLIHSSGPGPVSPAVPGCCSAAVGPSDHRGPALLAGRCLTTGQR